MMTDTKQKQSSTAGFRLKGGPGAFFSGPNMDKSSNALATVRRLAGLT